MAYELIFTSVPRGLKPGSRGFSTVAFTEGMPANYVQTCETLSGYTHAFQTHDPNYARNPIAFSHYRFRIGGQAFSILSRVAAYGTDYSERSNKLAHHIMVTDSECVAVGPAWTMTPADFFATEWKEEPHLIKTARRLREVAISGYRADHWCSMTGDAGWAGAIAQRFLDAPDKPVFLIFHPGQNLLPLVAEITSLLPEEKRWNFTYSTYFTAIPQGTDCFLRCCLPNAEGLRMSRRSPDALVLDLTAARAELAETGPLIDAARTGKMPVVTRPAAEKIAAAPVVQEVSSQPAKRESSKHQIRVSYAGTAPLAPVRQKRRPVMPLAIAAAILVLVALGAIAVKVLPNIKNSLSKTNPNISTNAAQASNSGEKEKPAPPDGPESGLGQVRYPMQPAPKSNAVAQTSCPTNGSTKHTDQKPQKHTGLNAREDDMMPQIIAPPPNNQMTNSANTTNSNNVATLAQKHETLLTHNSANTNNRTANDNGHFESPVIFFSSQQTCTAAVVGALNPKATKCFRYDHQGNLIDECIATPAGLTQQYQYKFKAPESFLVKISEKSISYEGQPSSCAWFRLCNKTTNLIFVITPLQITNSLSADNKFKLPIDRDLLTFLSHEELFARATIKQNKFPIECSISYGEGEIQIALKPNKDTEILQNKKEKNLKDLKELMSSIGDKKKSLNDLLSECRISPNPVICDKIYKVSVMRLKSASVEFTSKLDKMKQAIKNDPELEKEKKKHKPGQMKFIEVSQEINRKKEEQRTSLDEQIERLRNGDVTSITLSSLDETDKQRLYSILRKDLLDQTKDEIKIWEKYEIKVEDCIIFKTDIQLVHIIFSNK